MLLEKRHDTSLLQEGNHEHRKRIHLDGEARAFIEHLPHGGALAGNLDRFVARTLCGERPDDVENEILGVHPVRQAAS